MSTDRIEAERTLFSSLLDLPSERAEEWLKGVLGQLVELTQAQRGYVELYREEGRGERRLWASFQCTAEEEAAIAARTSRGIVASAVASGETVHTAMALLDERFSMNDSVQSQKLEAVLCVPFTTLTPGVLYLEGRRGRGPFSSENLRLVEKVARFLGPVLGSVTLGRRTEDDYTRAWRRKLKVESIVGRSQALGEVFEQLVQVAGVDVSVLFLGESGTGKTQLARALHASSRRAGGPFVEVNCAAIPETLVEGELFGTKEGAFTGAKLLPGKVQAAHGGTLFLDEVGELPLASQAKLLQVIAEKRYYAVGSNKLETANVRVVAATNADLQGLAHEKRFRSDLFHRLSAFVIRVPSIAERKDDLPVLVDELLDRIASDNQLPRLSPSMSFRTACEVRDWPGNVRELRNRLEQAVLRAVAEGVTQLEGRHLDPSTPAGTSMTFARATTEFQRHLLQRELLATQWNVSEVARHLDITRQHVYNLVKAYGLKREPS